MPFHLQSRSRAAHPALQNPETSHQQLTPILSLPLKPPPRAGAPPLGGDLIGKPGARAAETRHDLVDDKQHLILFADLLHALPVARRRDDCGEAEEERGRRRDEERGQGERVRGLRVRWFKPKGSIDIGGESARGRRRGRG